MPGVETSGALSNVRSYEFGDYEVVCYCVMGGCFKVRGEGFFLFDFHMWGLRRRGGSGRLL